MTGKAEGATIAHVAPEGGDRYDVLGDVYALKLRTEDTGGVFALWDLSSPPGNGPPPHVHRRESETFYVLEGTFEFISAADSYRVRTGSVVHVPKDTLHTFRNAGTAQGRALVLVVPGGFERFFAEIGMKVDGTGRPALSRPPDLDQVVAVARKHACEIPPPGPS